MEINDIVHVYQVYDVISELNHIDLTCSVQQHIQIDDGSISCHPIISSKLISK